MYVNHYVHVEQLNIFLCEQFFFLKKLGKFKRVISNNLVLHLMLKNYGLSFLIHSNWMLDCAKRIIL